MAVVYKHIRLDKEEVFYIGIGKNRSRAYNSSKGRSVYWKNIVAKTEYQVDILFEDLSWEEACEKEKELITLYGRRDLGLGTLVNLTDGGEGSINLADSIKDSISTKIKALWTEDKRRERSLSIVGNTYAKGPRTEETKQKMRKPKSTTANMRIPKKRIQCPECGLVGGSSNMKRYHFDNCKTKKD